MIQMDYNKLKKQINYINNIIHEINSIEILKNRIENELSSVIDPNIIKSIISGEKEEITRF
ncbi:hypothetical protein [Bacillus cereus]|uniref:Uncharacterized protein n=1 Tax=Bacillus cereus TaxID=1396 RepID=A0AAE9ZHH8_BACCE|nr:hypothetical protein [Bacillus cereus]WDR80762.1 hypothetical protein OK229_29295 [Bacillus cereus]